MLSTLLLLTLLSAEPQKLVDTKGWSATEYNDALVNDLYAGFTRMNRNLVALGSIEDPAAFQAGLAQLQADAQVALERISFYPGYKGDTALRDAIGASFLWAREQTTSTLPELYGLYNKPEVKNADLKRAEELVVQLTVGGAARDELVQAAQKDFARKNGMILIQGDEPDFVEIPEFKAPGIPPEGSPLAGQAWLSFVLRYHNQLADQQSRMVGAMNAFFDATQGDLGQVAAAREKAVAEVSASLAAARAMEDWQGDASLRDAVAEFGGELITALNGPFSEYVGLIAKVSLTKKEANRANALADEGNAAVQRAFDRFNPRYDDFRARYHFAEYEAWLAASR